MTRDFTAADLDPSRDPVALLGALVDLPRDRLAAVRDSLRRLLHHADPDVRVHAVRRLLVHLKDREYHHHALDAFRYDSEPKVRRAAAFAISATSSEATRSGDERALLDALQNPNEDLAVRGAAYEALLLLHGRRDFPPVNRDIDLERDVDWQWVRNLLREA